MATWLSGLTLFDGNPLLGRLAYTYGATLDQPLSVIRIAYGDTVWNGPRHWWAPFAVIPHWTWRGRPDYSTFADGAPVLCPWQGEPSNRVASSHRWSFALSAQPSRRIRGLRGISLRVTAIHLPAVKSHYDTLGRTFSAAH